ncbi:LamG-like jellyroll fold domain-containing protein [Fodinicola feengrottensis]
MLVLAVAAVLVAGIGAAGPVAADTAPPAGTLETATADPQPTWQTDGIVWALARSGSTVIAGGDFGSIRPPGTSVGDSHQQVRHGVAAFDIATGNPTAFQPDIGGTPFAAASNPSPGECDAAGTGTYVCKEVLRVKTSPDGKTIYLGGDFDHAEGQVRQKLAAYDLATGALVTNLAPSINSRVRAIAVSNTTVYIGGDFTSVNGQPRTRLAAFDRATGALLPWAPTADHTVYTMALSTDGSHVIVGGVFDHINSTTINGIATVDATSGATMPWSSRPVPPRNTAADTYSTVWDLVVDGNTVYAGANGHGPNIFDGRFAADVNTGNLIWKDNCYGATSAIALMKGVLYSASHAHDCSDLGAFGEVTPRRYQRLLAETADSHGAAKPTLLHWFPTVNPGPPNSYYLQGPWAMANDDTDLWVGGEFTTANGQPQQGLTRYVYKATAPDVNPPEPMLAPMVTPRGTTSLGVNWQATWDRDNANLTYSLYRDGGSTPIYTVSANSNFWTLPVLRYVDNGLAAGSSHTYTVKVTDPFGNSRTSPASAAVAGSVSPLGRYGGAVAASGPSPYWQLNEKSGTTAADATGSKTGRFGSGIQLNQSGAPGVLPNAAIRTNGTSNGILTTPSAAAAPTTYSIEFWFGTAYPTGGKLVGFGNAATGNSTNYDRQIYINNAGKLVFGVWNNGPQTITSPGSYQSGGWHHVVATQGATGMALYVDGALVGTNPTTTAQAITGYWRLGGDNLAYWPGVPASNWFHGGIDDVAFYPTALTALQVGTHYSAGNN